MALMIRSVPDTGDSSESLYHYEPSLAVAIVAAAFYGVAFLLTLVQWARYKSWVWLTMVVASAMEAVGYIARCVSSQNVSERPIYVLQFSLIILAPVLMAACCYILFSRIVFLVVPREFRTMKLCWIPPRFITPIFVGFDIVALLLQLVGAVMLSSVDSDDLDASQKMDRGKYIAMAGVIIQLIAFGIFSVAAARFNFTSKRFSNSIDERFEASGKSMYIVDGLVKKKHWPALLRVTNFSTLMILVRSIYRLIEFTEGNSGYTNTHEWVMYVFDALVIFPCVALYIYWHPGKYLPYLGFRLPKHAR